MPLTAGSVTVNADETHAGTGLALAIYEADKATRPLPTVPALGSTAAPWRPESPVSQADVDTVKAVRLAALQEAARLATAYAGATIAHITTEGRALVDVSVGRVPDPPDPGEPIDPPFVPAYLQIV